MYKLDLAQVYPIFRNRVSSHFMRLVALRRCFVLEGGVQCGEVCMMWGRDESRVMIQQPAYTL